MKNNQVIIVGNAESKFKFDHECFGENFYRTIISVERESGTLDKIPVIVSERLFDITENVVGKNLYILGEYRSHNVNKKHLMVFVFAIEMYFEYNERNINEIYLEGFICKYPIYRTTPLGRQIADIIFAVRRPYGKSDYIPCVCWGRNASYSAMLEVGQKLRLHGRIQSREYTKNDETKIAYEVSISKMELIE